MTRKPWRSRMTSNRSGNPFYWRRFLRKSCFTSLISPPITSTKERSPRSISGNCSPWSKDLRVKKALVCVCKNWRILALPYLYSRIYLHRVGQLCALVRVLEESSRGYDGTGYSSHVHHIHGRFFVPGSWETVYYKNIVQLLTLCASTWSLS